MCACGLAISHSRTHRLVGRRLRYRRRTARKSAALASSANGQRYFLTFAPLFFRTRPADVLCSTGYRDRVPSVLGRTNASSAAALVTSLAIAAAAVVVVVVTGTWCTDRVYSKMRARC